MKTGNAFVLAGVLSAATEWSTESSIDTVTRYLTAFVLSESK